MRRAAWMLFSVLLWVMMAPSVFAQDGLVFDDGRLDQRPDVPAYPYCSQTGGLDVFLNTGGESMILSRAQIEVGLGAAAVQGSEVQVAVGNGGIRLVAFPDGGLALFGPLYQFVIPRNACEGFSRDYTPTISLLVNAVNELQEEVNPSPSSSSGGPVASGGGRVHVVQRGENLFRIGLRYGVSYVAIAQANGINDVNRIFAGQQLVIP